MSLFQFFMAGVFLSGGLIVLGVPSLIGVMLAVAPFFLVWVGYNQLLPFTADEAFGAIYISAVVWWLISLGLARLK